VASPPSSTTNSGPSPPGQVSALSVQPQYSSSVSPFQAYTGVPLAAIAAAAWSCVENMLHDSGQNSRVGSVDAGKSTLTAVLLTGKLDTDKKKPLRNLVAKHPHERELGRTSDISTNVLHLNNKKYTFIDLCGHEKYLGTTTFGMTGYFPDFAILAVAANRGILPMTKEHMGLLITLKIPIIITITREDLAQKSIYDKINKLLRGVNPNICGNQ